MTVGNGPLGVAVDQATNTIYVANSGENTVSVIDGATCNAMNTSGCGQDPPTVRLAAELLIVGRRPGTRHDLRGSFEDNTVSVINGATCNGNHTLVAVRSRRP